MEKPSHQNWMEIRQKLERVISNYPLECGKLGQTEVEGILAEIEHSLQSIKGGGFSYFDHFHDAPIGYVVVDWEGTIISANQLFGEMVGSDFQAVVGSNIEKFIHPDFTSQFSILSKGVLRESGRGSTLVKLLGESKEVYVKLECSFFRSSNNEYIRIGLLDVTREVINEQQLIESRERYRAVADYAYHWEYWQDPQGRLMYMSPSCERITGYSKFDFFENPKLLEEIIHPDDRTHFDDHKSIATIPGETRVEHTAEYRITRKDGKVLWIGHTCVNIYKDDGTHIGLRATNRDISDRKSTREELNRKVEILKQTQEIAHVGSWELNVESNALFWSDEIYRIFGMEPQAFNGSYEGFLEIIHPDDREAVNAAYVSSLRDDANVYEIEHRIVRRDTNEVRYVYEKCYHKRNSSGRVIRSVGMIQDITNRKQREQKLVISDRIFNHALDMLCIAGFDGFFKTLNPAWSKVLGYSTEELLAKPWLEYVHPDDKEATKNIKANIVDGQEVYQFENRYICKDGTIKWLSWNSFPYPKENIMYGVARDITFKKHAEEKLQSSELQLKEQVEEYTALNEELNQANDELRSVMEELNESNLRTKAILSALPDLMFVLNREGVYIDFYSPNDSLLAAKPSEFLGKSAFDILPKGVAEENMRALKQLFETGKYQSYSYSLEDNNETKYFDARLVLFGSDRALAIVRDITEQKKGQLTIAKNEQYLKTILQTTADGFWITDLKGNLLAVNEAYCKMSGYSLQELTNLKIEQIDVNENPQQIKNHIGKIQELGSDVFETKHRRKDGTIADVEVSVNYLNADGGQLVCFTRDITERKNAQEKLLQSEQRFKLSMEATNDGLWDWNVITDVAYYNPSYYTMLGYDIGGFPSWGDTWINMLHPDDRERTIQETNDCIEGLNDSFEMEYRMQKKNGDWLWILSRGKCVERDKNGKAVRIVGTHIDIMERKQFEETLQQRNQFIQTVLDNLPIGVALNNIEEGQATYMNKKFQEIYGWSEEALKDIARFFEMIYPDKQYREELMSRIMADIQSGDPERMHWENIRVTQENGSTRIINAVNIPLFEQNTMVSTVIDVTEQKEFENALKESETRFKALHNASFGGITIHDKGLILDCNQGLSEITGYSQEELIGMNGLLLIAEETRDMVLNNILAGYEKPYEAMGVRKDGSKYPLRLEARNIPYKGKQVRVVEFRDITEQKGAELALKAKMAELEAIYNNSPLMMCILDENQNVVYANSYLVEFFGKPYQDIINRRACGVFGCVNATENKKGCGYGSKCPTCDLNNAIAQTIITGESLRDVEYNAVVNYFGENKDISLMAYTSLIKTQKKLVSLIFVDVSERKQMEDALRESEEMMRSSQSVAQICSYSTNLNEDEIGKSAWVCSPEFYNIFGIDDTYPHTIEGWANFIHPDYRDEVFAYHASVVKEKESFNREYKIIRINDGEERWVLGTGELVYDEQGKPVRMYGAIQDITERKHAENALRESEERFRGLYENATVGIYRTTPDGQILLANPALVRMLEYSSFEELTRRNLNNKDYETGFERTEFMRLIEERGEVKGLQSAWRTKSGKIINISESARAVYDNKGKVLYYEGIVEDITERKKALDALRASQERISSIFRVAPIGIGVVVNRVLTEVNQTICDIIGYAKDELLGQSAQILYPTKEEFEYVGKEKYRQITVKGTGTVETIWQRKDGSLINVLLSSTPIVQGDLSQGVTFTALDITQRKQNERLRDGRLRLLEFADTHSLSELLKETLAVAEDLTGSQIGFYHFIDEENGEIKLNQWSERTVEEFCKVTSEFDMHYPIDKAGIWTECIEKRKPLIHNDYISLSNKKGLPEGHAAIIRELTVPVIRNKRIMAVLGIGNKTTDYTKNDIDIITQLADMAWDIAERKMTEEHMLKLSKGIEQSFSTVVITDFDGNMEFVNPRFTEVTGFTDQEVLGQNPRMLKSDYHSQEFYKELWDTIKSGKDWRGELCNKKKSGEIYWESASISPIKNEKGEIVNFIAVKEDITDRKNAILALEQNNRLINTMLDNLPVGIFMVDALSGKPIIANEQAKKLLGNGIVEDAKTETLAEVYRAYKAGTNQLYPTNEMPVAKAMHGISSYIDDMEILHPDGSRILLEVFGSPVYNSNGEVWASLIGFLDITERKRAEESLKASEISLKEKNEEYLALNEELTESNRRIIAINHDLVTARQKAEESDKLKSAFLANMSHEIRTPMNAIIGFSEMLLNPNLPNERKDFFAQILNTACHQLLNVVEDVIDISKIETGQMEVHQSEIQINQTVSRIKEIFLPQASSNGVQITITKFFPDGEDRVITDANKLNQVLTNLVNNAVKFTDSGTIHMAYSVKNGMLEFSVSDTGVGIDKQHHELIFERFRQVEMGSTRQYGGTGLGLPISKSFIEMLGGAIWLESEPGKGSTFFFTIPYNPTLSDESANHMNDIEFDFTGKTILIAEDEEANFLYINELIEETGAKIIRATNGQEAIDVFFSDADVHIILMDIKMPLVGGIEATEAIRQRDKSIPIIALTAYAMSSDRERCLSAGCNKYLSKPVRRNELLRVIADIIM